MNDFQNIKKPSEREESPDYMIEDNEFVNQMMAVTSLIKNTDFDNHESRASFMMHLLNMSTEYNDKQGASLDVISALSSHIIVMMQVINGGKESYLDHFDTNVIYPMIAEGSNIPLWDDNQ